jgi:hypothetical protein
MPGLIRDFFMKTTINSPSMPYREMQGTGGEST